MKVPLQQLSSYIKTIPADIHVDEGSFNLQERGDATLDAMSAQYVRIAGVDRFMPFMQFKLPNAFQRALPKLDNQDATGP